jgi:DNA-binding Lrp family transcriptional regulator
MKLEYRVVVFYDALSLKIFGQLKMQNIFVQIKCELGKVYDVAEAVVDHIEEAEDVYSISGAFDLMIKFHLQDDDDIGRFVNEKVQTLPGIKDTFTMMAFKAFK